MLVKNETKLRVRQVVKPGRISKIYSKKLVGFGKTLEVTTYKKPRVSFKKDDDTYVYRSATGKKTQGSVNRTRTTLFQLIEGNLGQHGVYPPVFVTLTFKENLKDLTLANYEFKKYIKRFRYFLSHDLKYVCVPEFQKRGAVHFHMVFFNLPFVSFEDLENIWGHGMTNIQSVREVRSMGAYLTKYFSKSANDPRMYGRRAYFTSRGLIRPIEIFGEYECDEFSSCATIIKDVEKVNNNNFKHNTITCRNHINSFRFEKE